LPPPLSLLLRRLFLLLLARAFCRLDWLETSTLVHRAVGLLMLLLLPLLLHVIM
jgi:hypothetical protein